MSEYGLGDLIGSTSDETGGVIRLLTCFVYFCNKKAFAFLVGLKLELNVWEIVFSHGFHRGALIFQGPVR